MASYGLRPQAPPHHPASAVAAAAASQQSQSPAAALPARARQADFRSHAETLIKDLIAVQQVAAALVAEEAEARAKRDEVLRETLAAESILASVTYKLSTFPQSTAALVIASDGFTYDSYDLEKYIAGCRAAGTEPKSANDGQALNETYYPANHTYRDVLQQLRAAARDPISAVVSTSKASAAPSAPVVPTDTAKSPPTKASEPPVAI